MKTDYKLFTFFLLLLPFLAVSQKNIISFTYFNDLNFNKTIRNDFGGAFESPRTLMDNKIYNLTFQMEYERLIKRNLYLYGATGLMNKDFKSPIVTGRSTRGITEIYQNPIRQKYNFLTFGVGLKQYYNLYNLQLFSKIGIQTGYSLEKPNNPSAGGAWGTNTEKQFFSFEERVNSFFLGFGLTKQIIHQLSYKIEANLSRSFNPVITEIQHSKVNTLGLGIGIEYFF